MTVRRPAAAGRRGRPRSRLAATGRLLPGLGPGYGPVDGGGGGGGGDSPGPDPPPPKRSASPLRVVPSSCIAIQPPSPIPAHAITPRNTPILRLTSSPSTMSGG